MKKKQKVEYLHPNVLFLVTTTGVLIELFTPSSNEMIFKGRGLYFLKKTNEEWKFYINMAVN